MLQNKPKRFPLDSLFSLIPIFVNKAGVGDCSIEASHRDTLLRIIELVSRILIALAETKKYRGLYHKTLCIRKVQKKDNLCGKLVFVLDPSLLCNL